MIHGNSEIILYLELKNLKIKVNNKHNPIQSPPLPEGVGGRKNTNHYEI